MMTDVSVKRCLWFFLVFFLAAISEIACAESNFELAGESRLPRWFAIPVGLSRQDVTVSLRYYAWPPTTGSATFKLWDSHGRKLAERSAPLTGHGPRTLGPDPYPSYEVITYNGTSEVIEQKRPEALFYISDDPIVREKLGVTASPH
ncbi:MAG TPA: hypothetical protein VH583_23305 [Vicinamibacterales bacterium]|jgi:hypothetical protein